MVGKFLMIFKKYFFLELQRSKNQSTNNITLRLAMQGLRSGVIILSATGDTTMAAADQKIDEEKIRKT